METWIFWLAAAAVLLIVEIMTSMVWTLCLSVGCLAALGASLLGFDLTVQMVSLAVVAVLTFAVVAPRFKRRLQKTHAAATHADRTGMDALLGRKATVTHEIKPGELGRVRIDGDSWQACAPGLTSTIERGRQVSVTGYDSIILTVTDN